MLGLLLAFAAPGAAPEAAAARPVSAPPPTFTVNVLSDAVAVAPLTDGICDTGYVSGQPNGTCSLRAAIMKANHWPGGGATIVLPARAAGIVYSLDIPPTGLDDETTGDLNITSTVTILGGGASRTIVDGASAQDRLFYLSSGAVVTMSAITIQSGHPLGLADGGAIYNLSSTLTLINSRLVDNHIDNGDGGAVVSANATLMIYGSTIISNTALEGGGIENADGSTLVAENSTLSGNRATNSSGGGLFNADSSATLVDSTVSGNSAVERGGGIGNSGQTSVLNLYNVTVANNTADSNLDGIGTGGGVANDTEFTGTVVLRNSLLADNFASTLFHTSHVPWPNDCSGLLDSASYNLIQDQPPACPVAGGTHDQLNVAAHLGPLQDNGGPTLTQALLPGSPAIDAGNPGGCAGLGAVNLLADQRGRPRTANGLGTTRCDIGAFELQRTLSLPLVLR